MGGGSRVSLSCAGQTEHLELESQCGEMDAGT